MQKLASSVIVLSLKTQASKQTNKKIMSKSDKYYWQSKDWAKWQFSKLIIVSDKAPQDVSDTKSLFYFVFYILGFLFCFVFILLYFILGDWVVRLVYKKKKVWFILMKVWKQCYDFNKSWKKNHIYFIWFIVFLPCSFLLYSLVSLGLCTSIMIIFIVILICVDLV